MIMMSEVGHKPGCVLKSTEWLRQDGSVEIIVQPLVVVRPATRAEYESEFGELAFPHKPDSFYHEVTTD
jgi:hypothetical protein